MMERTEILLWMVLVGLLAVVALCAYLLWLVHRIRAQQEATAEAMKEICNTAACPPLTKEEIQPLLEAVRRETVTQLLAEWRRDQSVLKADLLTEMRAARTETVDTVQVSVDRLGRSLRESQTASGEAQKQLMSLMAGAQDRRLETVEKQLAAFGVQNREALGEMRQTMEGQLHAMQSQNTEQLEKMRATVDEKLQKTLDERISQSFQLVNQRLTEVYQGLGEMKTLAGSVGDLKKVLSGVKTRGILGEIQLGSIIEDMLTPDQYQTNVVTKPGTANPVEYAICLPGDGDHPVFLPIDAKFPGDMYAHLADAYESGDSAAVKEAQKALIARIKGEARDIHDKYIDPPHTTNFGIMFLPAEGLYAEVVRLGLVEELRQQYSVSIAGPTTLSALLNSLQMGFRTLAIQKRSGEVWKVLGAVKTEFATFEEVLKKAQQRIEQTNVELERLVGVRTRKINSKLRTVEELSPEETSALLPENVE